MKWIRSTLGRSAIGALLLFVCLGCRQNPGAATTSGLTIAGQTMGTTYHITVSDAIDASGEVVKAAVDSLLLAINAEVNTYDPSSQISRYNAGDTVAIGPHFERNLRLAYRIYQATDGLFDPSVGPLVEYYGFGASFRESAAVNAKQVDSLLQFVGLSKLLQTPQLPNQSAIVAPVPGFQLDFSAVAKGYAVDEVLNLLTSRYEVTNAYVEIGGETHVQGHSPRNEQWRLGVNTPLEGASTRDLELILAVHEGALATSGNYRNSRLRGEERYVHTIDPRDGSARQSRLLSATIKAPTCAVADAYATACMVAGDSAPQVLAKAAALENADELAACLIFAAADSTFDIRFVGDFEQYVVERL